MDLQGSDSDASETPTTRPRTKRSKARRPKNRGAGGNGLDAQRRKEWVDTHLAKLDDLIGEVTPESYTKWLLSLPRSYRYSFNNTLLVGFQDPTATRVQSYEKWREHGRHVRKGEKARIWVLGPNTRMVPRRDSSGVPVCDDAGNAVKTKVTLGFSPRPVYDISQTDADENLDIPATEITARAGISDLRAFCERRGITVFVAGVDDRGSAFARRAAGILSGHPDARGVYAEWDEGGVTQKMIAVQDGLSETLRLRVLAHEIGHHMFDHAAEQRAEEPLKKARPGRASDMELEAEGFAYAVCAHYGAPADDFAPNYISNWALITGNMPGNEARVRFETLTKGVKARAQEFFGELDGVLTERVREAREANALARKSNQTDTVAYADAA